VRPDLPRDPDVPSPEAYLGYPPGSRFTPYHRIVEYLEELAASTDRVSFSNYGETVEGRPLVLLTISDPGHLGDEASLQRDYARLADPEATGSEECARLAAELPVAVWLSFGVHGDESSSSEAALEVAYELASARDDSTRKLLEEAVVLLDPCLNPDGRERYVNWYRSVRGEAPDPEPAAREHEEPWPGGRTNHYLFDLNRDWAWLTQPESRARVRAYLAWHPQVHVDFHEMEPEGSYFFFPPAKPIHPAFPPEVSKWAEIFGNGNAAVFDARGWEYYTGERFDLYYPGYGDTWPTFHGAVGMTYEQAGHGQAGLALALADGDTLTLAERIAHHAVAALSTVEIAAAHRKDRLNDFSRFFEPDGRRGPAAYLFPPGSDPGRTWNLIDLLLDHGVEVTRTDGPIRPGGLHSYDGTAPPGELAAGTFVVSSSQPQWRFVQALLEPETTAPDTFFYDLSAWSLPLAYGIESYWTNDSVHDAGTEIVSLPPYTGSVVHPDARYAFLIPWTRNGAPVAGARLQEAGVELSFTTKPMQVDGATFPPGSLVVFRGGNPADLDQRLEAVARETGVTVTGVDSGRTGEGPDLGSPRVVRLQRPRVAILADEPVDPGSVGAAWFLLDRRIPLRHSLVTLDDLNAEALRDFDVLVFPDDNWGGHGYTLALDTLQVAAVAAWIEEGGTYVGLGGGAFFASAGRAGFSTVKETSWGEEAAPDATEEERKAEKQEKALETLTEAETRRKQDLLPGTIFRVRVDPMKPLGFGYDGELMVLLVHDRALDLGPPGTNVAWFEESARVSGYATPKVENRLADHPFVVDERRGKGHVVLFVSDPNFRLFWPGLTRLFLNAVYFVPSLAAR